MPAASKKSKLHGNVADQSSTVLVLVDVLNTFQFPRWEKLLQFGLPVAAEISALKSAARKEGIPVIYANDNFGRWRSNFQKLVNYCTRGKGRELVRQLKPNANDYFVLKAKNSGFYATNLDLLLQHIGARKIILAGFATDNCILFTANDAYMRDYRLLVPADCVASFSTEQNQQALNQMRSVLKANIKPWREMAVFGKTKAASKSKPGHKPTRPPSHTKSREK